MKKLNEIQTLATCYALLTTNPERAGETARNAIPGSIYTSSILEAIIKGDASHDEIYREIEGHYACLSRREKDAFKGGGCLELWRRLEMFDCEQTIRGYPTENKTVRRARALLRRLHVEQALESGDLEPLRWLEADLQAEFDRLR